MKNYDLIADLQAAESVEFDPQAVADLTVKQMHVLMTKLHMLRYALRGARQREVIVNLGESLQDLILEFQRGEVTAAITDADRTTLLTADVELARFSVALVVAQSVDANAAFTLFGEGGKGIDLSSVLKE
jgi:hypothetical protein